MSSSISDVGDALRPDGTLKDASEILWHYDEDESIAFPLDSTSIHPSSSGNHSPAMIVPDVRRSSRILRPSQRALAAAETCSSTTASTGMHPGVKRKARGDASEPDPCSSSKVINNLDDNDSSEGGALTEPDDDYDSIQAMADADNQVCLLKYHPHFHQSLYLLHISGCNLQTPSRAHCRCATNFPS